jgi:leader peptidase (prepilin peptidase)/N-methyltransferase
MMGISGTEIVSIATGLMLALLLLFTRSHVDITVAASVVLVLLMTAWIALRDIADFIIPDGPVLCIALVGAALRLARPEIAAADEILSIGLDALMCGGALFILREGYFRLRGVDGIGFGDVKLSAAAGILVGVTGFAWVVFVASATGLVVALVASIRSPHHRLDRLPFGAFLAPVCCGFWMLELMGLL